MGVFLIGDTICWHAIGGMAGVLLSQDLEGVPMNAKYGCKGATMIASALLACATAHAQERTESTTVEPLIPAQGTVLNVNAEGHATRTANVSRIRAGVVTLVPTAAGALSGNAAAMARVLAALRRAGIAPRDLTTTSIQLAPKYNWMNGVQSITGYQAVNTVSVRIDDVKRSGPVLDTLVAEGANQIDGPLVTVADPDAALDEARADAVKRARARAEIYAQAAGMRVVRIVSIFENGSDAGDRDFSPMSFDNVVSQDAGLLRSTRIQGGEKKVTANVSVRFLLR